jgi:hypothetical protein
MTTPSSEPTAEDFEKGAETNWHNELNENHQCHCLLCTRIAQALAQSRSEAEGKIEEYVKAFRHTHQALYRDGKLVDACAKCGLDIRDAVHSEAIRHGREEGA